MNINLDLIIAASEGDVIMVRDLISKGADPNVFFMETDYCTALMTACRHYHLEVVKLLLSKGGRSKCYRSRRLDGPILGSP